jgi:ubiquinone biosynthesis UbiH/UbiF/VisC/COQ6 family hydroxylase
MASHDIVVRGSGVVGMATALALSRQGLGVALVAPPAPSGPPAASDDVRAYAINRASVDLLASLKVWEALPADARTAVHDMRIQGDAPGAALGFSAWSLALSELAWIVDAAALEDTLRDALRFAPHVQRLDSNAAAPSAALTVLAEGRDSATRAAFGARLQRHAYGHTAIAARLLAQHDHAGLARQWFRSPDVLALLPLDRPERGRGCGLVWSLPDPRAQELLAMGDAAFEDALMQATGGAAGPLALVGRRASWPLAIGHAEPLFGPGWVLVGDAAHVIHPLAGQGLNLGLADVASLARVLAEREPWRAPGDERLLARHARARAGATRAMSLLTDGLLQLFSHPAPWVKELRNRGLGLVNALGPVKEMLAQRAIGR